MKIVDNEKDFYKLPIPKTNIAVSTNPFNRAIHKEIEKQIWQGFPRTDVQVLSWSGRNGWEAIPKWVFDTAADLAKAAGIKASMHAPLVELAGQNEQTRAQTIAKLFIALDTARKFATPSNRHIPVNTHVSVEAKRLFSKEHEEAVKKYLLEQYNKEHGTNINNFDELEKKEEFKEWLKKKYNVRAWEALVPAVDVIVDEMVDQ